MADYGYFHEKAGGIKGQSSRLSRSFPSLRIAPLPSALFVELMAPLLAGVLNFDGCRYLGTELNCLLSGS